MKGLVVISSLLIFVVSISAVAADEKVRPFKYPEARAARRAYEEAVRKADEQRARAISAAKRHYIVALDAALKAAMQRGDLKEANKLNTLKEKLEAEIGTAKSGKGPSRALVGVWRYPNGTTITYRPDGTYVVSWRRGKPGAWKHLGGRKFQFGKDVIELSEDLKSYKNPHPKAQDQTVVKVADENRQPRNTKPE